MTFIEKLDSACKKSNSMLCVGLDSDTRRLPVVLADEKNPQLEFNKAIIDATMDHVCAYKLNIAFYEVEGAQGIQNLIDTIEYIPEGILAIIDAKRSDIGNTATAYARALFETYGADAATVNPYMGYDTIEPFMEHTDKGVIVLCKTSNLGAKDFQDFGGGLFREVALKVGEWNTNTNLGVVVGATHPEDLKIVRGIIGEDMPILIPGIGVQGGDIEDAVKFGANSSGMRAIINSSRGIIFASKYDNYADAAGKKALQLKESINRYR